MKTLRQQFGNDFSRSAFKRIHDEDLIVGKFGNIAQLEDGSFDVHFVGPGLEPLTAQRMAVIRKNALQEWHLHVLDGEMWVQGRGRDFVLAAAALAGVKKKRRATPAVREALRRAREAQAA